MSDSLKDRLNSHSNAFEGLLSLIPQKYYYDEESKSQWNRKTPTPAEARRNKRAKFDPDAGASALDELHRREQSSIFEDDDDDGPIYDDQGNQIGGRLSESEPESDQDEPPIAKPKADTNVTKTKEGGKGSKASSNLPDSLNNGDDSMVKAESISSTGKAASTSNKPAAKKKISKSSPKEVSGSETVPEAGSSKDEPTLGEGVNGDSQKDSKQVGGKAPPAGIEELRAKLAARINELRSRRKAPGSDAAGAPKNREELLAARLRRDEQKNLKRRQGDSAGSGDGGDKTSEQDSNSSPEDAAEVTPRPAKHVDGDEELDSLMFGRLEFKDGVHVDKSLGGIEQERRLKKRNAIDQLKVVENRKAKMSQLDEEKRKQVAENAQWSRAILQSEGAKVRDNEALLRKTVKQNQKKKQRSEREWKARNAAVAQGKAAREAKRTANLEARKESKRLKKPSKKSAPKKSKGRAGFEGKKR